MEKTALKIHVWPDKHLKKKCKIVTKVDEQVRSLLDQMHKIMLVHDGAGLAANQLGLDLSLVVVEFEGKIFKLVNPQILKKQGRLSFKEGCLSFPGLEVVVRRAKKVLVSAIDENDQPVTFEAEGILAVIFQHEIDHINGVAFIDRVPFFKKLKIMAQLRALKKMQNK